VFVLGALSALDSSGLAHANDFGQEAAGARIEVWRAALLVFSNHPFIGIGWMNFAELLPSVIDWRYGLGMHAHDIYLSILAETGLIGFILFFAPIVIVLRGSARRSRSNIGALAGLLGITVFLVHGVVDAMFYGPQAMLAFGVALGLASRADK
jgi:O-antigen ligase